MKEIINFSTKFESLEQVNPLITKYRINICVPDKPAKKYVFSKSVIEGMSNTIRGAGVYAYYFEKEQQLGGHEDDIVRTSKGYKRTGEPVAYGFADPYQEPYWMEKDGEQWYTTNVYMWTGRNPHIEEALEYPVWQSMEVAVDDELDFSGNKIVKEAIFLGFCLLQGIQPAFEGSKIQKLSLPVSSDEIDLLKQEYEKFSKESKEGENVIIEAVEKFSLNSSQIHEILNNALAEHKYGEYSWRKYWVNCFDEMYAYVEDSEESKTYSFKYNILENVATIDMESKTEVIRGSYIPVGQQTSEETMSEESKTEEMSTEEMAKEEASENKEEMSSNEYVDNTAMAELNDKAAEENKELSSEQLNNSEENKDVVIASMKEEMSVVQEKMAKMEADMAVYMSENTELKEFKASIEKQNKEFSVETILKEVVNVLPKEELEACRLSSENFTLDNIDIWKNEVKAKAYNFSKGISEKKSFIQVALPITDKPKRGSGLWD